MVDNIYKIVFDGSVDEHVRNKIDECTFKDIFSDIDSNNVLGVKFYTKVFNLHGIEIIAQVWALNQNQQFNSLKSIYYKGANLIIFVKSNNSSTIEQLLDYAGNAMINPNQIILIENTKDFTESFFEFTIVLALYNDELISESEFRDQRLVYEKGDNPELIMAENLLDSFP